MKMPLGYKEAPVGGFTQISLGGHHLTIKQVNETKSKTGKDMIVVLFDFADNDSQAGLITEDFKNDTRTDKKWPHRGTAYILVHDWQDENKTNKDFKTFCTCFERSNNKSINWETDKWGEQFKGAKIGGAFGLVHSVYEGQEQVKPELRWFVTDDHVDPENIPNEKMLSEKDKALIAPDPHASTATDADGFMQIPDGEAEELPF